MPRREEAKLGKPGKHQGEGTSAESPARATAKVRAENPPSYGAQHSQDALWEGGNEALPPGWQQYDVGEGFTRYQDNNLFMTSEKRPLPGVRLDYPRQLVVPRCEWHVSPLGRSYFVNHNTRTTSWKKPRAEHLLGSLRPECTVQGNSKGICSLICVGASCSILSGSDDGSIHRWTRDGKVIGQPWLSDGEGVMSMALSPDGTTVVSGSVDGRMRLWNIKEGILVGDPWEGHADTVRCIDWHPNVQEIASGSQDSTIRRWNPNTGRQIARAIEAGQGWLYSVKYSPQGDKFASSASDGMIRVWSKGGELLVEIKANDGLPWVESLCWNKDGSSIFSGSGDRTIRNWRSIDGEELFVLRGHTDTVKSLCLSLDGCHLISASEDCSIRIWDLKTNKSVGKPLLHDDDLFALSMSPDGQYIASGGIDNKIYLWNLESAIKQRDSQSVHDGNAISSEAKLKGRILSSSRDILDISTKYNQRLNDTSLPRDRGNFWGVDTNRTTHDSAPFTSPSPHRRNIFDFMRFKPQAVDASQTPRQRHRWNFGLSTRGAPSHTVDVAASHDDDRIYIVPPSKNEMNAALQAPSGNEMSDSAHRDGAAAGVQDASAQIAQKQDYVADTDERSCEVGCCGIYFVLGSPRPH